MMTSSDTSDEEKESRKLQCMLALVTCTEGGSDGKAMSNDLFLKVMDLAMLCWDPLRKNRGDDTERHNQKRRRK